MQKAMEGEGSDRDPMNGLVTPTAPGVRSEEIHIDSELVTILANRSRRRLRELQSSCRVAARMDRARQIVHITGTEDGLKAAKQAIESLSGPRRSVPLEVWAELMRTRTMSLEDLGDSPDYQVSVAWIQDQSGCRLHIERGSCEVRIFGPKAGIEVAYRIIDEIAPLCTEESVPVQDPSALTSPMLQSIAHACSATFRVQSSAITILGLKRFVRNAAEQLRQFLAVPQSYSLPEKASKEEKAEPNRSENVCPTCRSGPFCGHCGQMIWKSSFMNVMNAGGSQALSIGNMENMNNMNNMNCVMPANMVQSMPMMQSMQTMQSMPSMQSMQPPMMVVCMPMALAMQHSDMAAGG